MENYSQWLIKLKQVKIIKTQRRGDAEKKSLRLRVLAFYTQGARIENVKYIVYKKIETLCE